MMSKPICVRRCKELHFVFKRKLLENLERNLPELFYFDTVVFEDEKNVNFKYSWQVKYSVSRDPSYGHRRNVHYKMDYIEVNLLDKLTGYNAAYVNIAVIGYNINFKFDSKSSTFLRREMTDLNIVNPSHESMIHVNVELLLEDKTSSRIIENYNSYVKNEKSCNVELHIGDKKFSAHREILSAHSAVFASMFENDMIEKNGGKVQIEDVEPVILKYLIDYIYFAEVDCEEVEDWLKLIVAADKYSVMTLLYVCENRIAKKLNPENVAEAFTVADLVKSENLKKKCVKYIVRNKEIVRNTDGYKNLVKTRIDLVSEMFSYIMLCCSLELESDNE